MKLNPEFFESLINFVGGGIVVADVKGEILFVNESACQMLGYTPEGLVGSTLKMITWPDDQQTTREVIKEVVNDPGNEVQLEKIYLKKNGDKFYGLTTLKSHMVGDSLYISAFINDFSDQYAAKLRAEKHYEDIIELADDVVFTVDVSGNFLYANKTAQKLTGFSQEEILKSNYLDIVSPSHRKIVGCFYRQHFLSKENKLQFTFPITDKVGVVSWLDQKLNTIWDNNHETIVGYSAVARNITQERLTSLKLSESKSHYHAVFNQSPIPKQVVDFSAVKEQVENLRKKGVKDFGKYFNENPKEVKKCATFVRVIERNSQALVLHGAKTNEELDKSISQVFTEEYYETFAEELVAISKGLTLFESTTTVRTIQGELRFVELKWMVLPSYEDSLEKVMVTTLDVTDSVLKGKRIKDSQIHYKALFNDSAIALRLEDFSRVDVYFTGLRKNSVKDLRVYFAENPTELMKVGGSIKVIEINKKYLNIFGIDDLSELYKDPHRFITQKTIIDFIGDLDDLYLGVKEKELETEIKDVDGNVKVLAKKWISLDPRIGVIGKVFISSTDITSKKLSEQKIIANERNYQALFNESPVPLWLEDLSEVIAAVDELKKGGVVDFRKHFDDNMELVLALSQKIKVLQVNQRVLSLHNASSFEELMQNFPVIFTSDALQAFKGELLNLINKTPSKGVDCVMNTIDKQEVVVHMQWSIMPGHEDTYDKIFVSSLDITEKFKSQQKIKKNEQMLSTVFENLGVPILISDPIDASIVGVNKVAINALGYDEAELLKMNIYDLDATHGPDYVIKSLQRCYKEGLVAGVTKWRTKAGQVRDVSIKNSLINISGEDKVLSACLDITELKQLNIENERFRIVMDNAPFAIYISNADNNELIDVNTTACEQLGYSRTELLKMSQQDIEQIDLIQDAEQRKEHSRTMIEAQKPLVIEGIHKRKDGTLFPVKVTVNARNIGDENYVIASVFDDTWAKETNLKLQQVNQALSEEINFRKMLQKHSLDIEERERKRVARDLHDGLGQRLTGIKLSLGAIKNSKKLDSFSTQVLVDSIKMVEGSMGEVRAISQDILPVVLSDFGLDEALKKVCDQMTENSAVTVQFETKGMVALLEDFVKTSLYRIGQECINNAIKYAKSKEIDVRVVYDSEHHFIELSVIDYGIGFDPKKVKKGMGLNNIRERAEMIQAEMVIESIVKKGTRIQVKYLF